MTFQYAVETKQRLFVALANLERQKGKIGELTYLIYRAALMNRKHQLERILKEFINKPN